MRALRALALAGAAACAGGGGGRATGPDANDAVVKIRTSVADAALWIDGRFIGPVGGMRGGFAIDPGKHRLELRHDAYFSHYQELDLAPRQRVTLEIDLAPVLP